MAKRNKLITLPYGITVTSRDGVYKITSNLYNEIGALACSAGFVAETEPRQHDVVAAVDAIEAMILSHASSKRNITGPSYLAGVKAAVHAAAVAATRKRPMVNQVKTTDATKFVSVHAGSGEAAGREAGI